MKVSLAIPAVWWHRRYLLNLFGKVLAGTVLPDEIVIGMSPVGDLRELEVLRRCYDKALKIKWIFHEKLLIQPEARHALTEYLTGDIVVYHDSDDWQLRRRIETVKVIFNRYPDLKYLSHSYIFEGEPLPEETLLPSLCRTDINLTDKAYGGFTGWRVIPAACAIRREVLDEVSWSGLPQNTEDREFAFAVYRKYQQSMIINSKLFVYNNSPERRHE